MSRKRNDQAELVRCVKRAWEVVNEALPLDFPAMDITELRKIAFSTVLRELLDYES